MRGRLGRCLGMTMARLRGPTIDALPSCAWGGVPTAAAAATSLGWRLLGARRRAARIRQVCLARTGCGSGDWYLLKKPRGLGRDVPGWCGMVGSKRPSRGELHEVPAGPLSVRAAVAGSSASSNRSLDELATGGFHQAPPLPGDSPPSEGRR